MKTVSTADVVHVPAVGGDVQVRRIPPKLLRVIQAKVAKDGGFDFNELMVQKLVLGLVDPNFTEDEAREILRRWSVGALRPVLNRIDELSGTDEHLDAEVDHSVAPKLIEPVTIATAWLQRFPIAAPRGRAPRPATNVRRKGSKRTTGSRSTSSGEDGDPELRPRRCKACGADISHRRANARTCGPRCRKALQRLVKRAGWCKEGHAVDVGRCERCGAIVRRPRQWWKTKPIRSRGASPNIDVFDEGIGDAGQLVYDHRAGPLDSDVYTLKIGGEDGEGERPLRVRPTTPTTIEDRREDWRLIYARWVARGELMIEGARRIIATIEREGGR